jgi:Zn-dependent peptidase ImmA (M78 family)
MGRLKEVEQFAEDIVEVCLGDSMPIDPFKLAKQDGIILVGDDFGGAFDGMAEVVGKQFVIYYDNTLGEDYARTRFTVAHELGHCEIESHRRYLLSGGTPFPCKVEFQSPEGEVAEWEADTFASSLLLPGNIIEPIINVKEPSISMFKNLANNMKTSLTSTLLRCVSISDYACAVMMIDNKKVRWSFASECMKALGLSFIPRGFIAPNDSAVRKIDFSEESRKIEAEGECISSVWFPNHKGEHIPLWEEVVGIPSTKQILLLLLLQNYEQDFE